MNARGIPPAVYWVLLLLSYSYLGTPPLHPDLAGGGYLTRVPPQQGIPWQGNPPSRVPPGSVPPWLDLAGYPPGRVPPPAGPGRVPPPQLDLAGYPLVSAPWHSGKCCKALWDMGTPPVDRQIDGWMEGQTRVKTLPSRCTTYAGGN